MNCESESMLNKSIFLFLSIFIQFSSQALPVCQGNATCPPGGLWTEWSDMSSGYCSTSCGSCSRSTQQRKCVSSSFGCNCTGSPTRQIPCNTQTCPYPAQRTCCIPYIAMKINGTMQCGPFEKPEMSRACCKDGGYWGEWGSYTKAPNGEWVKTRDCLSTEGGCPCTGIDSYSKGTSCPCKAPEFLTDQKYYEGATKPGVIQPFVINNADCTATQKYDRFNTSPFVYCRNVSTPTEATKWVPQIRFKLPNNTVITAPGPGECFWKAAMMVQSFTCDQTTLNWRYDKLDLEIVGIGVATNPIWPTGVS